MAREDEIRKIAAAQQIANKAIEEGNDLTRNYGMLLKESLTHAKHLGVVQKANAGIITRQLAAEKAALSNDDKRKNLTRQISYLKLQASKYDEMGHTAISEQLKELVKGLNVEKDNLDVGKKRLEIFDGLIEKAKDLRNKLTIAALFTGITAAAFKFAARIDKIGETFGSLNVLGKDFQTDLLASSVEATKLGGGLEDVASITNALASDFGMSVDQAAQLSGKVFDTSKAIGLSAEEGANLFGVLTQTANLSAEQAESLAEGTFQLARQAGVAPNAVLKDLAGSAEEIALFTEEGGDNIAEAAVQARRLGLSLSTTAKISEGLLDFESSIRAEQEASVLIGRQLNLQRARELALQNDIAGATKEVVAQLGSEAEFTRMSAIERQGLAKAIGVSVSELSKLVGQSNKRSLSGALAAGNFEDLLGQEGLSNLSSIIGEFKALSAELVNSLGPALETAVGSFRDFLKEGGGLEKISSIITSLGKGFEVVAGSLPTVIGLFVALKSVSIGAAIASAMAATSAVAAATLGIGVPVLLGVLAAAATKIAQFTTVDDFKSGPGGINFMSGPAGAFKLNPRDSVLATTNPIQVNDMMSGPPGSLGGGGANVQISSKMVKLGGGDLGLAIDAYTYPANTGQGRTKFESLVGRG